LAFPVPFPANADFEVSKIEPLQIFIQRKYFSTVENAVGVKYGALTNASAQRRLSYIQITASKEHTAHLGGGGGGGGGARGGGGGGGRKVFVPAATKFTPP